MVLNLSLLGVVWSKSKSQLRLGLWLYILTI